MGLRYCVGGGTGHAELADVPRLSCSARAAPPPCLYTAVRYRGAYTSETGAIACASQLMPHAAPGVGANPKLGFEAAGQQAMMFELTLSIGANKPPAGITLA